VQGIACKQNFLAYWSILFYSIYIYLSRKSEILDLSHSIRESKEKSVCVVVGLISQPDTIAGRRKTNGGPAQPSPAQLVGAATATVSYLLCHHHHHHLEFSIRFDSISNSPSPPPPPPPPPPPLALGQINRTAAVTGPERWWDPLLPRRRQRRR
jgi:hypothetical protein